ncbi:unnamed protein product [marine sediment metagenome]|uniref:Uncharacterized protein n=1 Tax=marine sediment metagenome TaxID=412755 RepID=X1HVS1_9ZZZZ
MLYLVETVQAPGAHSETVLTPKQGAGVLIGDTLDQESTVWA